MAFFRYRFQRSVEEVSMFGLFSVQSRGQVTREKAALFALGTAKLWTKPECWCQLSIPISMQNYQATHHCLNLEQHHNPRHPSRFLNTAVCLFYLTSRWFHCSHSDQGICFHPRSLSSTHTMQLQVHSADWVQTVRCFPSDGWRTGPLPTTVVSTDEPRSYNFIICKSSSLSYHKPVLVQLCFVWCSDTLDDMKLSSSRTHMKCPQNTILHKFHRSRGSFPFNNFKCRSNGAPKLFSFKTE